MLILWAKLACIWLLKLVIPPPADSVARLNPNERCPVCGNRDGTIRFERVAKALVPRVGDEGAQYEADRKALIEAMAAVRHTCAICGFAWYEAVVSTPQYPAL